jgi:D-lactate dehydrogenase
LLVKGKIIESEKLKTTLLNHIFIDLDNVIVSPHNAFNTEEALESIVAMTIDNIDGYLKGKPINLVK